MEYRARKIRRGKMDINPPLNVDEVKQASSSSRAIRHPWGAETPVETPPERAVPNATKGNPLYDFFKKASKPYKR